MKKILLVLFALPLFAACSDSEDEASKEQEVWVNGYTAYKSTSTYQNDHVKFVFFKLDNNERVKEEKKTFSGSLVNYYELRDENYELLRQGDQIKLEDGATLTAYHVVNTGSDNSSYEIFSLPTGKYYVVAVYSGLVYLQGMYISHYALKYAGKYINIEYNSIPTTLSAVIPATHAKYGCIDWVSWNERFSYDF